MRADTSIRAILFVVNPHSGPQNDDIAAIINEYHQKYYSDVEVKYLFPDWEIFHSQLESAFANTSFDTIVACGGDGTVKSVAEFAYGKAMRIGILPCGSSNGLAKNLNIPLDYYSALEVIFSNQRCTSVAALNVNGHLSIHLADAGINANIVKRFEKYGVRGFWGYIRAGMKVLRDFDDFIIHVHDRHTSRMFKACMVVIANANMYGTGFVINHMGELDDNKFEIIVIKKLSLKGFLRMALNNWIPDPELIQIMQGDKVQIDCNSPLNLQVDGQYIGKFKNILAEMLPLKLSMIIG